MHFYWWRPGFRCQKLKEEVEKENTQDGEGNIDIPSVAQESTLLEASLVAPADTSVEGVEDTLGGPSIDEMPTVDAVPSAMTQFLDDGCPQQVDEVPGGILVTDEVLEETEGSKAVTGFTQDNRPPQFHQFLASLLALRKKATTMREAILQQNEELEGMRAVCAELVTKLTCIGEQLGSLMYQLECTLE